MLLVKPARVSPRQERLQQTCKHPTCNAIVSKGLSNHPAFTIIAKQCKRCGAVQVESIEPDE